MFVECIEGGCAWIAVVGVEVECRALSVSLLLVDACALLGLCLWVIFGYWWTW